MCKHWQIGIITIQIEHKYGMLFLIKNQKNEQYIMSYKSLLSYYINIYESLGSILGC